MKYIPTCLILIFFADLHAQPIDNCSPIKNSTTYTLDHNQTHVITKSNFIVQQFVEFLSYWNNDRLNDLPSDLYLVSRYFEYQFLNFYFSMVIPGRSSGSATISFNGHIYHKNFLGLLVNELLAQENPDLITKFDDILQYIGNIHNGFARILAFLEQPQPNRSTPIHPTLLFRSASF